MIARLLASLTLLLLLSLRLLGDSINSILLQHINFSFPNYIFLLGYHFFKSHLSDIQHSYQLTATLPLLCTARGRLSPTLLDRYVISDQSDHNCDNHDIDETYW